MGCTNLCAMALRLVATIILALTASALADAASCNLPLPSAVISQAAIRGFRDAYCNAVYLGIPFAATTGGKNR